jgi:hypothetical protein
MDMEEVSQTILDGLVFRDGFPVSGRLLPSVHPACETKDGRSSLEENETIKE